jgi:hypothetical protein
VTRRQSPCPPDCASPSPSQACPTSVHAVGAPDQRHVEAVGAADRRRPGPVAEDAQHFRSVPTLKPQSSCVTSRPSGAARPPRRCRPGQYQGGRTGRCSGQARRSSPGRRSTGGCLGHGRAVGQTSVALTATSQTRYRRVPHPAALGGNGVRLSTCPSSRRQHWPVGLPEVDRRALDLL